MQHWLGRLQYIVMPYFWWAYIVRLWQNVTLIKPCSLILEQNVETSSVVCFPEPKQHATGYILPLHTLQCCLVTVQNSSAMSEDNATLGAKVSCYMHVICHVVSYLKERLKFNLRICRQKSGSLLCFFSIHKIWLRSDNLIWAAILNTTVSVEFITLVNFPNCYMYIRRKGYSDKKTTHK